MSSSDGTPVPSSMKSVFEWADTYPDNQGNESFCISWNAGKLMNTRCDNIAPNENIYFDGLKSTTYTPDTYHRGYLCEAMPIHTVSLYQKNGGELCIFPFRLAFLACVRAC